MLKNNEKKTLQAYHCFRKCHFGQMLLMSCFLHQYLQTQNKHECTIEDQYLWAKSELLKRDIVTNLYNNNQSHIRLINEISFKYCNIAAYDWYEHIKIPLM
jgi:hypothetical protein